MSEKPHILVVDDEPFIRLTLEAGLSLKGFQVTSAVSGREALARFQTQKFDAVICDVYMPDGDGLTFVHELRAHNFHLPIILLTAQGSVELAVKAVAEGASDFIAKPFEVSGLADILRRHLSAQRETAGKSVPDDEALVSELTKSGMIGRSPAMVAVYKLIAFAARTNATVLITGETGTGKELVAKAIHSFSDRAENAFISVNCAGLTESLLEAELFGYVKGAFTGAATNRPGLFEAAAGGTIFLDELASTSANFQASLLRVLQSGEVRPVGATEPKKVDVRVIGASNENLFELVEAGKFRADLFYRLSVLTVELPALRRRTGDVRLLAQYFLRRASPNPQPYLTVDAWAALECYQFPGNVRELENALVRAVALAANNVITLDCLPASITQAVQSENKDENAGSNQLVGDRPTMDELQRRYLSLILNEVGGNRRRAATVLGLDRRTIQRLIARYNLAEVSLSEEAEFDEEEAPE